MAVGEFDRNALPFVAASAIVPLRPVRIDTGSNKRQVVLAATQNVEVHGLTGAATVLQGESVTVYGRGAVKEAVAAASLGAGADIGVASTNGALGPVSGASGVSRFRVGVSLEAAAAGEKFSVYVDPKQLSNLI